MISECLLEYRFMLIEEYGLRAGRIVLEYKLPAENLQNANAMALYLLSLR